MSVHILYIQPCLALKASQDRLYSRGYKAEWTRRSIGYGNPEASKATAEFDASSTMICDNSEDAGASSKQHTTPSSSYAHRQGTLSRRAKNELHCDL